MGRGAVFLSLTSDTGQQYLTLEVNRFKKRLDIDYIAEVSENLSDWFSGLSHTTILEDVPARLVVRDNVPISQSQTRMLRIKFVRKQ